MEFYAGLTEHADGMDAGLWLASFGRWNRRAGRYPRLPAGSVVAADCGAFTAFRSGLHIALPDYVDWLDGLQPVWAASIDVIGDAVQTSVNYAEALGVGDVGWAWVATCQGETPAAYARHALELVAMTPPNVRNRSGWRLGVGGLVIRDCAETCRVVWAVSEAVGVPLHLWGVGTGKARALQIPNVISCDSCTWSMTIDAHHTQRAGVSRRDYLRGRLADYRQRVSQLAGAGGRFLL